MTAIYQLSEDHRVKFEILKGHYGLIGLLKALRTKGYIPDYPGTDLPDAIDALCKDNGLV